MISLSLSLLPLTNEHLTIKILHFSCEANKHRVGAIPAFFHFVGFRNIYNSNPMLFLFLRFENPMFQRRPYYLGSLRQFHNQTIAATGHDLEEIRRLAIKGRGKVIFL
jgi:hypothetical protein